MTDLTIHGAGIFGLCCGWEAARRGAKVCVLDPYGIGAGASGGLVGALAPHAPEGWTPAKALQLDALLAAPLWWAEVEAGSGLPSGYGRIGRVQPIAEARAHAKSLERVAGAAELWRGAATWRVRDWAPGDPVSASGLVAEDTLSGRLHPRSALKALAAAIRAAGGEILPEAPRRGPVIAATGAAGLRALSAELCLDLGRGEKGQALSLGIDLAGRPQIYAPGLHIVPHFDGTTAIGSTSERSYENAGETDAQLDALHQKAVAALPELASAPILERWAGERPRAASRTLLLDRHPRQEGTYIANGGFKTGFAMAPLAAKLLIDLVLEGKDAIPADWRFPTPAPAA